MSDQPRPRIPLPEELQKLVRDGILELLSSCPPEGDYPGDDSYHIPKLRHKERRGFGVEIVTYTLTVCPESVDANPDESGRFELREDSESQGDESLLVTDDADEMACKINELIEGFE